MSFRFPHFLLSTFSFLLFPVRIHAGCHFKAGLYHCVIAAQDRGSVFETLSLEIEHRTGARVFGRSRAVGGDHFVARQFINMSQNLGRRNQPRAFDVTQFISRLAAHIDNNHIVARDLIL
jgi:hypothetical protein